MELCSYSVWCFNRINIHLNVYGICKDDVGYNNRQMVSRFIEKLIRDTDVDYSKYPIYRYNKIGRVKVTRSKDNFLRTQIEYNYGETKKYYKQRTT